VHASSPSIQPTRPCFFFFHHPPYPPSLPPSASTQPPRDDRVQQVVPELGAYHFHRCLQDLLAGSRGGRGGHQGMYVRAGSLNLRVMRGEASLDLRVSISQSHTRYSSPFFPSLMVGCLPFSHLACSLPTQSTLHNTNRRSARPAWRWLGPWATTRWS